MLPPGDQVEVLCVAALPRGAAMPRPLAKALQRPGVRVTTPGSDFAALAVLLRESRRNPGGKRALLVVDPNRDDAQGLLEAQEKYAHEVTVWVYETEHANLRAVQPADRRGKEPEVVVRPPPNTPPPGPKRPAPPPPPAPPSAPLEAPRLRLTDEGPITPQSAAAPTDDLLGPEPEGRTGRNSGHLLSAEELAMLLAMDEDDGTGRGFKRG